jgi:hypothetical protein
MPFRAFADALAMPIAVPDSVRQLVDGGRLPEVRLSSHFCSAFDLSARNFCVSFAMLFWQLATEPWASDATHSAQASARTSVIEREFVMVFS